MNGTSGLTYSFQVKNQSIFQGNGVNRNNLYGI